MSSSTNSSLLCTLFTCSICECIFAKCWHLLTHAHVTSPSLNANITLQGFEIPTNTKVEDFRRLCTIIQYKKEIWLQ